MKFKNAYFFSIALVCLFSCAPNEETKPIETPDSSVIKYAERFSIENENGWKKICLYGNKHNKEVTTTFIVYTDSAPSTNTAKEILIKVPCKKVAALSSIYARIFFELGALENLLAIDNIDYINCKEMIDKYKRGQLKEVAKGIEIDMEKTIVLKPDIIFSFGMGEWEKDRNRKVEQAKIPIAVSLDHLEQSPLARVEWIKFFAAFVNKSEQADSIFNLVEKNYLGLKKTVAFTQTRPTVFNEIKYSDSWYMPGGKSYVAQMLRDAGADYLWKDNEEVGSLPLSFEQVYAKAKDADYWINLSTVRSKTELLAYEKRYAEFKAFKSGELYNNNRFTNEKGYSIYWETGMIFPDRILSDLIQIFHPELKTGTTQEMYYYEKIN
jgi:iron complex transport system substrate-binding protein